MSRALSGSSGVPPSGRQAVRGDGLEALKRHPPGDVLGVGVETPVFVDDDDARELAGALQTGGVGAHISRRAGVLDISRLQPRVVLGDDLHRRAAAFAARQPSGSGGRPARDQGELFQEPPAVHLSTRVFSQDIQDIRGHRYPSLAVSVSLIISL